MPKFLTSTSAVRNCWNCGHFMSIQLIYSNNPVYRLCQACSRGDNGHVLVNWGECSVWGIKKSELVDHHKTYAPCP